MKNPHGVRPTRYRKRKESDCAIYCDRSCGPVFYQISGDIYIPNNCNEENCCLINNDRTLGYECHPEYKKSLFVNTNGPDDENQFTVLDYEVFGIDNYKDYIYNTIKYPDIIWTYIQTKNISGQSLIYLNNDTKLLKDMDTIHCKDNNILLKISKSCLKNPSQFLPNTRLVDKKYDSKLREWLGSDSTWKLLYRFSNKDSYSYAHRSFHGYCDGKEPTLIVIKSTCGWIFGGYTTRSWSINGILNHYII